MSYEGWIPRIFSPWLTHELERMTLNERATFLLNLARRWGELNQKYRKVKRKKGKRR